VIFSGRTPTRTFEMPGGTLSVFVVTEPPVASVIVVWPLFVPATSPSSMFDAPRNPATNSVVGDSYTASGGPIWSILPWRITASRSDMVMASSWSCVT
jgi:hypothetical protein